MTEKSPTPVFDCARLRLDFPIFAREIQGKPLTYLDNGATAQKPQAVIDTLSRFFSRDNANIHRGVHYLSREATDAYDEARRVIKTALNLPDSHEAVFVRGTTEGINLVTHGLVRHLSEGDEILLTIMEHHANFVPWQVLAQSCGAVVRVAGLTPDGALDLEDWKAQFTPRTRIAAFAHTSNVLGTVNPVAEMTRYARERGVLTLVDGAQAQPHGPVDLQELAPDFYVFSGHKVFGPDGIGVLTGPREWLNSFPPYQTGGDMIERVSIEGTTFREAPERFEAGTPNISAALGLAAAFRYLEKIDWKAAHEHEQSLAGHAVAGLKELGGITIQGNAPGKVAIVSYLYDAAHPHDVGTILDTEGVAIRVGHHCAQPLMDYLRVPATARASFAFYNDHGDVERFLAAMHKVKRFFGA